MGNAQSAAAFQRGMHDESASLSARPMNSSRAATLIGALVFLAVAAAALYRLLFGFPIIIGGAEVGQTSTFFAFVISVALALMLFRSGKAAS